MNYLLKIKKSFFYKHSYLHTIKISFIIILIHTTKLKMLKTDQWSKLDYPNRSYEGSLYQGLKQGMGIDQINHDNN